MAKFDSQAKRRDLVLGALFTAMVIILQLIGCIPQISANKLSFVLVPIVIGGACLGIGTGIWLGFVFGAVVFIGALSGLDVFTAQLISLNFIGTLSICLVKGMLAGLFSALVFKALKKFNFYVAIIAAAIVAPLVNTSLYCVGMILLFKDTVVSFGLNPDASLLTAFGFVFVLVLINFVVELIINVVLCPAVGLVIRRSKRIPYLN